MTSKCHKCPPGSYCPGGRAMDLHESVLHECPQGSTSPSGSASIEACQCRRGYFWDLQIGACSLCPPWHFKNHTGPDLCTSCPQPRVSKEGAIGLPECYCPAGTIGTDFSGSFNCADLSVLGDAVSTDAFALTEALMYSFIGSVASFSGPLEMVRLELVDYLGLSRRASLLLTDNVDEISYKIMTSEEEEAATLHAKMDPPVFAAFRFASATATLTSDMHVTRSPIASYILRCPDGSGFVSSSLIRNQSDCKCLHGMEPISESGFGSSCTKCPRGKHKSTVGDVMCSSCGGLTTLLEGAISAAACTCPAGFINEALDDPTNCQPCGKGFYCSGGKHKQACGQSFTTVTASAREAAECVCAPGFFRVDSVCEPCPQGTFKEDIGDAACQPCPAGRWSNESAAAHQDACNFCSEGSTTSAEGARDLSFCVRPQSGQLVQCTSGTICSVEIVGFQLQDGHRLALTQSSCDTGIVAPSSVVAQGISKPATQNGRRYVWGNNPSDFSPEGGLYNLCWCASMRGLLCGSLQENFTLSAGQLEVTGPLANHQFDCVRGQDCSHLTAFQGHLLSLQNQVAVRNACGGPEPLSVALANPNGTGSLSTSGGKFSLSFGEVLLDADESYSICWCSQSCNTASDFTVLAGHLQVLGPYANQRADCFLGQKCRLEQIRGVGLMTGDQIMLRTDCETGRMLTGSPGDGIASRNEAGDFEFGGHILTSTAGIFSMCFCRPGRCDNYLDFRASLGFFTARGPFQVKTVCHQGQPCDWELLGIGLTVGDRLVFRDHSCSSWSNEAEPFQVFMELEEPVKVKDDGNGLQVDLGVLPFTAKPGPGAYQICWCPSDLPCTSAAEFRASAGDLHIGCRPGFYYAQSSKVCARCPKKFYCSGGGNNDATKVACAVGETTLQWSAVSNDACVCMPGYGFVDGQCIECTRGSYKSSTGNQQCMLCPENTTTFSSKASSNCSCVAEGMLASATGESESNESLSNVFEVPVITFSVSIVANGTSETVSGTVASALRSMLGTSAITKVELSKSQEPSNRRLSTEQILMVTLTYMTLEEADASAQELDLDIASDAILEVLREDPALDIVKVRASNASVSLLPLTCPENALVPPGAAVLDVDDCVCKSGYEFIEDSKSCSACASGEYKTAIANENCQPCPARKTTWKAGATSIQDCICEAGTFDEEGECSDCIPGFFCPGSGKLQECPPNTQSLAGSARTSESCVCTAGYFSIGSSCEPCRAGRYKGNAGNEPCTQLCPANAESDLGATSSGDCFCIEGHHAILSFNGQLDRCASCSSYPGLVCPGGFVLNSSNLREHLQPRAAREFYKTGNTAATKCRVVLPDGSNACLGGNLCGEGTTGMLCGECPLGWSRFADFIPCEACWAGSAVWQLGLAVLFELTKIAVPNFVLAALAAMDSANANLPLHTYMIRVFTQWLTACALITHFNLELLETPFAQSAAVRGECDNIQLHETSSAGIDSRNFTDIVARVRLAWPPEVNRAMVVLFDIAAVVPTLASVKFSAQCLAFELFPARPDAQRLAPALYYISLPVLTICATLAVCAVAVYAVVPLARRIGVHFNKVARDKQKKRKLIEGLLGAWVRSLPLSEIPLDLPRFRDLNTFIAIVDSHEGFARELCRIKCTTDLRLDSLLVDAEISLETFQSVPQHLLFAQVSREELKTAIKERRVPQECLLRMVQCASTCASTCGRQGISTDSREEDSEVDPNSATERRTELRQLASQHHGGDFALPDVGNAGLPGVDVDSLDFGLFSPEPSLKTLLKQSLPVVWPTLIAVWPQLLSRFLSLMWCTTIQEDGCVRQRLVPNPDVVCLSDDHLPSFLIAVIGLSVWCVGIPGLLFCIIYRLGRARQELESRRKYGLFIRGLEPWMWWWDLLIKRADIALMMLVAYTSMVDDETAKLFVFAFISAMLLCITTWSKPYSNNQGQILDILETSLLTARFVLYFMVAMLLILFPSPTTTRMCAYFVLVMLASVFAFALLHIFAQILRQQKHNLAEEEDEEAEVEDSEEIMAKKTTTQRVAGQIQVFKLTIVEKVIPFFQEDDAEKWILSWSPASGVPSRVTASRKSARRTGRQSWAMEDCHAHSPGPGLWSRIRPAVLKARAIFLRFGTSVQRSSVVRAYEEFHSLWLDQLEQNHIPNVGTLCTLVASHQTLPSKGDVGETWINEAKKVLEDSEQKWRLPAHEFTETVHRLRSLPIQQALNLVKAIDRFFAMQDFHTEANARRKSKESNPTLLYIQAKDGGSPEVVETLPYIPTEDGGRHEVVETLPYIPTEEVQEHIGFPLVPGALADQDGHTNQEGFDLLQ